MDTEFIDSYSDDQIFLHILDQLIEGSETESGTPELIKISACCRLYSVLAIGSIDSMVIRWAVTIRGAESLADFAKPKNNQEKINNLKVLLHAAGIQTSDDIFEDYLAIKFIRNAYIHSNWRESQKKHVIARGFPEDLMHFDRGHFDRIRSIHHEMMNYIGFYGVFKEILENHV